MRIESSGPPDHKRVEAMANKFNDLGLAENKAGNATMPEVFNALVHALASTLANNADPEQRALGIAAVQASLPELVRRYSIVNGTAAMNINQPQGSA